MSKKLITTVVIPYYNGGKYIEETLNSLFNQKLLPDEVIIVNDGSTEATSLHKLKEIKNKYAVKVLNKKNGGISDAINTGAKIAKGDIIFQLDSDDILLTDYVERFVKIFENNAEVDGVTCGYKSFYNGVNLSDETNFHRKYMPEGLLQPKIFFENCAGGPNGAFRKSALEKIGYWDKKFTSFQDWSIWLNFLKNNLKQYIIPEYLYLYRVHKGGDSQRKEIMLEMSKKLCLYKGLIECNDAKCYSMKEYAKAKERFYDNQEIIIDKENMLQNNFSCKKVKQLGKEFYFSIKREGIVMALKRAKNFAKYGKGKVLK